MSCCPPGALGYLQPSETYTPTGTKGEAGGCEFYATGSGAAAIILFPDVWGWNSGRTRAMADEFGRLGYTVYVPKLLTPALEGGTDGDGLPPGFEIETRGAEFGPWVKNIPWAAIEPKVKSLIAHVKRQGATSMGVVGCCWGGWAAFHTSAICVDIVAAVIFHPSCQLEGMFGGDVAELCERVRPLDPRAWRMLESTALCLPPGKTQWAARCSFTVVNASP
jgi:dienelactone hydrolase